MASSDGGEKVPLFAAGRGYSSFSGPPLLAPGLDDATSLPRNRCEDRLSLCNFVALLGILAIAGFSFLGVSIVLLKTAANLGDGCFNPLSVPSACPISPWRCEQRYDWTTQVESCAWCTTFFCAEQLVPANPLASCSLSIQGLSCSGCIDPSAVLANSSFVAPACVQTEDWNATLTYTISFKRDIGIVLAVLAALLLGVAVRFVLRRTRLRTLKNGH